MKFFKKIFLIIVTFLVVISLSTLFIGCPPKPTEEVIEKTIEEVKTTEETEFTTEEEVTEATTEEETEADIEKKYISAVVIITLASRSSLKKCNQAASDLVEDKISISEQKAITKKYIEKVKALYDMYLELKPSKRLEKSNDLYGKAMDHLLKSAIFLQSYIDTDDIEEMKGYLEQSINELNLYNEYILKAAEQVKKITE